MEGWSLSLHQDDAVSPGLLKAFSAVSGSAAYDSAVAAGVDDDAAREIGRNTRATVIADLPAKVMAKINGLVDSTVAQQIAFERTEMARQMREERDELHYLRTAMAPMTREMTRLRQERNDLLAQLGQETGATLTTLNNLTITPSHEAAA